MIRFDRYEENRMYLGFTEVELDVILTALEKQSPEDEVTRRIDALVIAFSKKKQKQE